MYRTLPSVLLASATHAASRSRSRTIRSKKIAARSHVSPTGDLGEEPGVHDAEFARTLGLTSANVPIQPNRSLDAVPILKRSLQDRLITRGNGQWIWDSNTPEVLRLEPITTAAHFHGVGGDEQLCNVGQQEAAEHLKIPLVRRDEVEAVMRVGAARVEHRLDERFQLGDDELGPFEEARFDPVDRAEPSLRVRPSNVAALDD